MKPKKKINPNEVKNKLVEVLKKTTDCYYLDVVSEDNDVLRKYDMGYAIAILPEKYKKRKSRKLTIVLIRFNVRTLTITKIVPIAPEFFTNVIKSLEKAYKEYQKLQRKIELERRIVRVKRILNKLSEEEKKILKEKFLKEGD